MLQAKSRWDVQDTDDKLVADLVKELTISPLIAKLLINRGFHTAESADVFLRTKNTFYDPFLLNDMDIAVHRINEAIRTHEKIRIFGDYDADGISSTVLLLETLQQLGATVDFYIPNRFTEGYGPNERAFRLAKEEGITLLITVDTGISALFEAGIAKEIGMDLIITDHHEPGEVLPEALAIIHPKLKGSTYPFKELAGVGVAFKLAHALFGEVPESLLDIACIGTIADLVPLEDENRLIAKLGIEALRVTNRVGVQEILKTCGVEQSTANEETVGFAIAPRINAAGRLQSADIAVHLLMSKKQQEAHNMAEELDNLNKERQQLVNKTVEEAVEIVNKDDAVLIVAKEGWNAGVVGIVASKLVDLFYRPTIVLSIDKEKNIAKGSARSIAGFDLFENLSMCKHLLPHFGGHSMAAGMTLPLENLEPLQQKLNEQARVCLTEDNLIKTTSIDATCELKDVTIDTIEQLEKLAPFGMKNPRPQILFEQLDIQSIRRIGTNQSHIKMIFEREGVTLDSVGFGFGYVFDEIANNSKVNVVGGLSINEWNNFRKPQLMIQDMSVSSWQLFDFRGARKMKELPMDRSVFVAFNREAIKDLELQSIATEIVDASNAQIDGKYVVFLDMPPSKEVITKMLANHFPERIYVLFHQMENHFFNTLPTREHFTWFYKQLFQKKKLNANLYATELARLKGWSKETIHFMAKVFSELGFVTVQDGMISLVENVQKRDLTDSKTYQHKQEQLELEQVFIYSNYQQLKCWFDKILQK